MARTGYWLTPPTRLTFIISVVLVILALLVRYAHVSIPVVNAHVFETLLGNTVVPDRNTCESGERTPQRPEPTSQGDRGCVRETLDDVAVPSPKGLGAQGER